MDPVQDSWVEAEVLVDDVQPQEGGERGLGAGAEPHRALVGGGGGTEDLAVGTGGVPELAHLYHEGADAGLAEAEGGHGGAVTRSDDDGGRGVDRGGLCRVGGLEAYAGEAGGGGRLEGDHAQDLASRQVTVCQLRLLI